MLLPKLFEEMLKAWEMMSSHDSRTPYKVKKIDSFLGRHSGAKRERVFNDARK